LWRRSLLTSSGVVVRQRLVRRAADTARAYLRSGHAPDNDRNPNGWVLEQKITVEKAVHAYTSSAAHASFEESQKGTLAAGKLADLVMLDRNIFDRPAEEIRHLHVTLAIVGDGYALIV
jgi:predicted amidohydrolase YtcJ